MYTKIYSLIISLAITVSLANGQTMFLSQDLRQNKLSFSTGLQPGFVYNIRYDRLSRLPFLGLKTTYFISGTATYYRSLADNSEWELGAEALLWEKSHWAATAEVAISNGRLGNKLYIGKKWASHIELSIGYFGKWGSIMALAGYNHNHLLKLEPTEYYKSTIYSEGANGWYRGVGGYVDVGLESRFLLMKRFELGLRILSSMTTAKAPLTVLPAQADLDIGWRF